MPLKQFSMDNWTRGRGRGRGRGGRGRGSNAGYNDRQDYYYEENNDDYGYHNDRNQSRGSVPITARLGPVNDNYGYNKPHNRDGTGSSFTSFGGGSGRRDTGPQQHSSPRGRGRGQTFSSNRGRGGRQQYTRDFMDEDIQMNTTSMNPENTVVTVSGYPPGSEEKVVGFMNRKARTEWEPLNIEYHHGVMHITVASGEVADILCRMNNFNFGSSTLSIQKVGGDTTMRGGNSRPRQTGSNKLAEFLQERWDPQFGYLNLEELPPTSHSITVVLSRLLIEAKSLFGDTLVTISFARNKLWSVKPAMKITELFPNIQNISFEENDIAEFRHLDPLANKLPQLMEIVFNGNPIQANNDPQVYQTYFPLFDSNRAALLDLYDPQAILTVGVSRVSFAQNTWGQGLPMQRLTFGNENIIKRLTSLPPTIHDLTRPENFVTDAWQTAGSQSHPIILFLTVHGEFREERKQLVGIMSFCQILSLYATTLETHHSNPDLKTIIFANLHIPQLLLARILLQLCVIPQELMKDDQFDLLAVLAAGLREYGHSADLNGFLTFCLRQSCPDDRQWWWNHVTLTHSDDWNQLEWPYRPTAPVGLHVQIGSEAIRTTIDLDKSSKQSTSNRRLFYYREDRATPIDSILHGTLDYLHQRQAATSSVDQLIHSRLKQYAVDGMKHEPMVGIDLLLMGALMVRYDSLQNEGYTPHSWCLYLRDYIESSTGSVWRVLGADTELRISSPQALADIRGCQYNNIEPSTISQDYRPVYLFYCNQDVVQGGGDEETKNDQGTAEEGAAGVITWDDYTFYEDEEEEIDDAVCKICGIAETKDNINTIFFCDHCSEGVHQLCEDPPIAQYEMDIDPWFCRACSSRLGIPLPSGPVAQGVKRRREEEESM
ncbi:nuclear mRNA export, poly(A)+RNA binding protein [Apophysomyces ossiformis]|uniref:Nuclear mRNA export, poly(A)+RNA binding protein n=1 Tax=Apophysomyces ossiformis TaxID=679940 RepID=A0A8H7ER39_9FUNG|nr:nuclear mRNA export, poly(A)+RNA binding protein [Apophysomyces ossiformis]